MPKLTAENHLLTFIWTMDELASLLKKEKTYASLNNGLSQDHCGSTFTNSCLVQNNKRKKNEKNKKEKDCYDSTATASTSAFLVEERQPTPSLQEQDDLSDPDYVWEEIYSWMLQVSTSLRVHYRRVFIELILTFFLLFVPFLQIVDAYDFDRECIFYAMSYFDRSSFADKEVVSNKIKTQLRSITSLYLAVKVHDKHPRVAAASLLKTFAKLDECYFSRYHIFEQEQEILKALEWKLCPPTPQLFLYNFMMLLWNEKHNSYHFNSILEVANYMLDSFLPLTEFKSLKASSIAMASLEVALRGVKSTVVTAESIYCFQRMIEKIFQDDLPETNDEMMHIRKFYCEGERGNFANLALEAVKRQIDNNCTLYDEYHSI